MSIKKYVASSVWNKLTMTDKAQLAVIFVTKGKTAALKEAAKRAAKNTLFR